MPETIEVAAVGAPPMVTNTKHASLLSDVRFDADAIAHFRERGAHRWLAYISTFGRALFCDHDPKFGRHPIVVEYGPELGAEIAEGSIGIPLNYARREDDGQLCHFTPVEGGRIKAVDARTTVGLVAATHVDATGVLAELCIWSEHVHAELLAMDAAGRLADAGLCLVAATSAEIRTTAFGLAVARPVALRPRCLDFASAPLLPGSVVLRPLADGETLTSLEWAQSARNPSTSRPHARRPDEWTGVVATDDIAPASVTSPKIGTGEVQTTNIGSGAVTNTAHDYQSFNATTTSTTPSDIPGPRQASIVGDGSPILVVVSVPGALLQILSGTPDNNILGRVILDRDGTTLTEAQFGGHIIAGGYLAIPASMTFIDTPGAGTFTYKLKFAVATGTGNHQLTVVSTVIDLLLLKR